MASFEKAIVGVLNWEGGYQSFSNDSANYCSGKLIGTNRGISAVAYKGYYGTCPTIEQIKSLTKEQALFIYKKNYWDPIKGDDIINQSVAEIIFSRIIGEGNSSIPRIKKSINTVYGKDVTILSNYIISKTDTFYINKADQQKLFEQIKSDKKLFLEGLASSNPEKYGQFIKGWLNRLKSYIFKPNDTTKLILLMMCLAVIVIIIVKL
jgi:lysozyme family protein